METSGDLRSKLTGMLTGFRLSQAVAAGARLGIPDLLAKGPKTSEQLAAQTKTDPPTLRRLLRTLAAAGLLSLDHDGRFALTPLGELLRRDVPGSLYAMASYISSKRHWQAWGDLLERMRTGASTSTRIFTERWEEDPEASAIFDDWMTAASAARAELVLDGYDFSGIEVLADVGGGRGRLLASILNAYPEMRGILFDLPHVIEGAPRLLAEAGVAHRCTCIAGDFFESVPRGADAYLMSVVIHDWNDERAVTIMRNCRNVMKNSGRLLLVERVIPAEIDRALDALLSDLNMLVGPGGLERTAEEFGALFLAAGLTLNRLVPLKQGWYVLEGAPV